MFSLEEFKKGAGRIGIMDVEAIGLQGEAFAVSVVGITIDGPFAELTYSCPPAMACGSELDRLWVQDHVPPLPVTHATPRDLREAFWKRWELWQEDGSLLLADCSWPVEANFLSACVHDDPDNRVWNGPYPLLDLAPFLWAAGINPLATLARQPEELPVHHPLHDARQSARVFLDLLKAQG